MLLDLMIGARKSDLARLQAYRVGETLKSKFPQLKISYQFSSSLGDLDQTVPLWAMGSKGVFTEDFVEDLRSGKVDLVVHSFKDLPVEPRSGTEIVATLPREDVRDVLLVAKKNWPQVAESRVLRVLSSSPRRAYNLAPFLAWALPVPMERVEFVPVRGNVPTRIRKLIEGEGDALVVAKAALDRLLGSEDLDPMDPEFRQMRISLREMLDLCQWMVLPLSLNPGAAAQGALAVEIATPENPRALELRQLLKAIHSADDFENVQIERRILASHGGGCHQKIGVVRLSRPYGKMVFVRGLTDQGERLDRRELESENAYPKVGASDFWPQQPDENIWFERRSLGKNLTEEIQKVAGSAKPLGIWVGRISSWPEEFKAPASSFVWTAGLKTWKKLAARGIWVHGSAEGLGEIERPEADGLSGQRIHWVKISHDRAGGDLPTVATYTLEPKKEVPQLQGKTDFFWMSGSSFREALKHYPEIRDKRHACGPGHTHHEIKDLLGPEGNLKIFLSYGAWRRHLGHSLAEGDFE